MSEKRLVDKVRKFITSPAIDLAVDKNGDRVGVDLKVATVVLLLELSYGDDEFHELEAATISAGMQREFNLSPDEASNITAMAESARPSDGNSLPFMDIVNERYSKQQKTELLKLVWKVVCADDKVRNCEKAFALQLCERLKISPELAAIPL